MITGLKGPFESIPEEERSFSHSRDAGGCLPTSPPRLWERLGSRAELIKGISSSITLAPIRKQGESGFGCFAKTADEPREQARMDCPPGLLVEPFRRLPLPAPDRDHAGLGLRSLAKLPPRMKQFVASIVKIRSRCAGV